MDSNQPRSGAAAQKGHSIQEAVAALLYAGELASPGALPQLKNGTSPKHGQYKTTSPGAKGLKSSAHLGNILTPQPPITSNDPNRPGTLPPITGQTLTATAIATNVPTATSPQPWEQSTKPGSPARRDPQSFSLAAINNAIEPAWKGRIKTGMDVMEYFASMGHTSQIKMFHAVRANMTHTDCPYELAIVPKEAVSEDYYTISAAGVVHMQAAGLPAEFIPIGDWVREHSVFNIMKQLPFFKSYLIQRFFSKWKAAARHSAFQKVKQQLESRLFLAKTDFCSTIIDIAGKISELKAQQVVDLAPKPRPLEDFAHAQREMQRHKVLPAASMCVASIERLLNRQINDVKKREALLRHEVEELDQQISNAGHVPTNNPSGSNGTTQGKKEMPRSLVKLKAERIERARALRATQQEMALLPSLIRLADYMLVEGSLDLLVNSVEGLRSTMISRPIISAELSFAMEDKGMVLVADVEEARKVISNELVDSLVALILEFPRVLHLPAFKQIMANLKVEEAVSQAAAGMAPGRRDPVRSLGGPDLKSIMPGFRPLQKARLGIGISVDHSYKLAMANTSRFDALRVVHDFCASWDTESYKTSSRDVAQLRRDCALLRSWQDDLAALTAGEDVECLHISLCVLQNNLTATLEKALDTLLMLLTAAAHKEAVNVLEVLQKNVTSLATRPTTLDEFAAFYAEYQAMATGQERLDKDKANTMAMYAMLQEYGGKVLPSDQVVLDDTREVTVTFNRALNEARVFVEDKLPGHKEQLATATQELFKSLADVIADLRSGKFDDPSANTQSVLALLEHTGAAYEDVAERAKRFKSYEELFGLTVSNYADVDQAHKEYTVHRNKWHQLAEFEACESRWLTAQCTDLDPEEIQSKVDEISKANYKMIKNRKDDSVAARLKKSLDNFKQLIPVLSEVANKALEERHWMQMFAVLGKTYDPTTMFCAQDLIKSGIVDQLDKVQAVGAGATKERSMLLALDKMEAEWAGLVFRVLPYKDTGTYIIGGVDDIQTVLDDQIVKIQAMNASPFVKPFKERSTTWEAMLQTLQDMIDNWLQCQATWLYLEPIFSSEDIVKQMPEEGDKFRSVDGMWRNIMNATTEAPSAIATARQASRVTQLVECNQLLEEVQKGLAAYLEKKRLYFPRFFFLSNDEMLEILSETKDPTRVQPHLKKCFEGISHLDFDEDLVVHAMNSVEKERVPFKVKVDTNKARGAVEKWLLEVESRMFEAVHDVTARSLHDYAGKPRHDWVLDWPGMVVLVVSSIYWTQGVTTALQQQTTSQYEAQCTQDLMKVVELVRGELTTLQRATLGALVVMDVHARDVVTSLAAKKVESENDFEWQAQLRSYWEADESGERDLTVMMRMMSASIQYGYEYLGNSSRLVITPLTDRCYRTLMGAIHLTLGGAPEGPAGTGKTETTKDLAKALARQCVVFNCSDSLDYIAMGKFFKGLASSGAWACFDEFNRIDLEVLSVVAQQVLDIQRAISARARKFVFEGTEMTLKWSAWCAITMNPGYAGRSELPDNLKALFRTVAMMVPDYVMIAEIMLFSYGCVKARECAKKIVQCYKLCSEQLSSQDHYDYGMRAVMAVLRAAGNLKRRFPDQDEYVLMLRSIIDVNLCKFLSHDVPLFQGIISDLFPGVVLPASDYGAMTQALKDVCSTMNLQPTEYFMLKTIQLYEMIVVRHGLMLVGLPFAGKTQSYRVLAAALTLMEERAQEGQQRAEYHVINPKAVTMGQLYGQFDLVSHEWTDGVLAVTFRALASSPSPHRKWLVLDGPVDAIWIENMNTVLDDNKKLCLNSGEIIQMSPSMNMIFEVADLAVASPATVSRCGMVYLEPHQLGWKPLLTSWLAALPEHIGQEYKDHLQGLFDWLVPVSLRWIRRETKEASPTLDANLVNTLMRLFNALTPHFKDKTALTAMDQQRVMLHTEATFILALVWSVGGTVASVEGRLAFDGFLRKAATTSLDTYTGPSGERYLLPEDVPEGHVTLKACPVMPAALPGSSGMPATCYDFSWDYEKNVWVGWSSLISNEPIPASLQFRQIIVPSVDTVRYSHLLHLHVKEGHPVLLVGPTGTGKSVLVAQYLKNLSAEQYVAPNVIGFSARTTANMTQQMIDAKLDRRRKGVFGPPTGKQAIIFVDDLNMPQLETYGAQPPIELLRQYMDHGGWYDRQNAFRRLDGVQFIAAMCPPGGGRNHITSRYARHFSVVSMTDSDDATLQHIFTSLLTWGFDRAAFPASVQGLKDSMVTATLAVYRKVMTSLLPTPTKSHYTFNLRDISRVMQGFLMVGAPELGHGAEAKDKSLRLWLHEILRVFYDRLVNTKDRSWFLGFLGQVMTENFQTDMNQLLHHLLPDKTASVGTEQVRSLFFGDLMDVDADEPTKRKYNEVVDVAKLLARVEEFLADYNAMSKRPMNLAIFLYAVEHVSRISRVLKQPGGHILCVGVGGSGRQSLARLAGYIAGMETFQIEISKSYTTTEWCDDLKRMAKYAGAEGKPAVFLFSDTQIKSEAFVEDINNLLNSGEVPNLFPYDERAEILELCRVAAKKQGQQLESAVELWSYFVEKTRDNLHVVLCFSPIGDSFRERLRQFPSLVNCCTIDWFSAWPVDALEAVSAKFLADLDVSAAQRAAVSDACKKFHQDVSELSEQYKREAGRINYVTPTSYLELITAFMTLLANKRSEVMSAKKRYEVGLQKLAFTAEQVVVMQGELTALKPNLIRTVAETERLMATVNKEKTEVVEPKKAMIDEDVRKAEDAAAAANAIKQECESALAEAIPILESAIAALDTIKPADIKLVQSFKNPPGAIKLVMEAVCVLLDVKPTRIKDPGGSGKMIDDYWASAQKVLTDPNFIKSLKDYDKDNVPPKIIERIRKEYTSLADFTPANAAKASSAAEGLCKWVCAMDSYDSVAKVVAPKKAALAEAQTVSDQVNSALRSKQADLQEVLDKLVTLEEQLEKTMAEKVRLEGEVEVCTAKLERAEKLISGLGGEKARWTEAAQALGAKYDSLTGDMLISAGVISYLGAFTMTYRDQVVNRWVQLCVSTGIPTSSHFSLAASLGDPVLIRAWGIAGLPNDSFSIDNGIMVANARRWPLMIDPQTQANKWIKNMERGNGLRVIKLTDNDYMRTLENAVQFGVPVLLENVGEELDPSLEPLLLKQLFKQGGVNYIRMGDTTVEFSDQFRFYITTTLRNPHYLPETAVKVTLLNFMITLEGLSDQLLGVVVAQERPDLEAQRQQLIVESANNKRRLKEIEDRILHVLSTSQGNILEDATAIQILSEAKAVSNEISEKEVVAEATQKEINVARVGYKPCGAYNAVLFFCIRDMAGVDPMYQNSLAWFIQLFVRSIQCSDKNDDLSQRLEAINNHFTFALYSNICRSLFEKDKLLFAFLLAVRIMLGANDLEAGHYQFLLTGGVASNDNDQPRPAQLPECISARVWADVCKLTGVGVGFKALPQDIAANPSLWVPLFDTAEPHKMKLPQGYEASLRPFGKVMLLKCLRPDKLVPAVQAFVASTLGTRFTEPPPFDLAGSYQESSAVTPLLFILSTGSDPTAALLQFAASQGYSNKISVISMGQGQGSKAAALIDSARKAGGWVLLQNCHLAPSWMPALEKICESIKPENTDPDFRLWMTSMPSTAFPVSILQTSIKMTNEPPAGLRANLRRSYMLAPISSPDFFESHPKPEVFKPLVYGLTFLHAFVQERRKFGPIGWNIPYGFDDGDLIVSVRQLAMYVADNKEVPFAALKYAIGECNYGGRVTDDKDRRLLLAVLDRIYRPEILTDQPFKFSASGTYILPPQGDHASYLTHISSLPIFAAPEAFGLHENADISMNLDQAQALIDTLMLTGEAGKSGAGGSGEDVVAGVVSDLLAKLPANFDIEKAGHKYPVRYEESLNQVLVQEMVRFNRLLDVIRSSLAAVSKALAGLAVLSTELDAVLRSLSVGSVPAAWKGKSFPSLKPLAGYMKDLSARIQMLQTWYEHGAPSVFWISGFFFTPSFTTAALQNYARRHQLPIDTVGFDFVMMEMDPSRYTSPPSEGVYIHGLYLEGAGWDADKKQLCESQPKVLFEHAPVIWLEPKPLDKFETLPGYNCPVYRTAERRGVLATTGHSTNYLMTLRLPSSEPEWHWTLRGVCLLTCLADD